MIKNYYKLIRDKILEIIKGVGEKPYWRVLNKKEYLKEVKKKVLEEAKELTEAKDRKAVINEVIDIQEIIDVLSSEIGLKKNQLKKHEKINA